MMRAIQSTDAYAVNDVTFEFNRSAMSRAINAMAAAADTHAGKTVMIMSPTAAGLHRCREDIRAMGGDMGRVLAPRPRLVHHPMVIVDDL